MEDGFKLSDVERQSFKRDSNGVPLPDGHTTVYCIDGRIINLPWCDYRCNSIESVFVYGDRADLITERQPSEFDVFIPWHNITQIVNVFNSDEQILAYQDFQDNKCEHVFDEERHHMFADLCHHECIVCGKTEGLHHEEVDESGS